ncbi:MAG: methyltransferase domain-containing protein [Candidatus Cloacimonadaceae bacterium]|nr:methyltransferase domain-containing protein [Candidatus Cloacimonadaceae bacterium]
MQYDPVKDRVSELIRLFPLARSIFYAVLDRVLLRQRYVKGMIAKYAPGSARFGFYDAGAGFCQYSAYVMKRWSGARVFATDLKADYLSDFAYVASKDYPGRFSYCQADLQDHIPQNKYDMAVAIDILEHIEDDVAAIRNIHACLNPGGHLIISTPSDTDEAAKFTEEHVRPGYAKADLEEKLAKAGFEIIESIYSYGIWGALAWRLLIKHPLSLLKHGKLTLVLLAPYLMLCFPICELLMQMDIRRTNKSGTGIVIVARKES